MTNLQLVSRRAACAAGCACIHAMIAATAGAGVISFLGLGDLPGGSVFSNARGVSGDGSVVVGFGTSASGTEAFRWTAAGGMVGLGDLAGGAFSSQAADVSADGSVVVGFGSTVSGQEAFMWDAGNGMQSIQDVLLGAGVDLTGWQLQTANGISDDGLTIVGDGIHNGNSEAWIVRLSPPTVPAPGAAGLLALAGVVTSRRRRRGGASAAV